MANKTIASLIAQLKMDSSDFTKGVALSKRETENLKASLEKLAEKAEASGKRASFAMVDMQGVMTRSLGLIAAGLSVGKIYEYSNAWTELNNRLKLVSNGQSDLISKQTDAIRIAMATRSNLGATADLYAKITKAGETMGLSQERIANVTESVNRSMQLSGGSVESTKAAILQFNQALASGVLRGEEFNSISEQTPALLSAIADGLGVNIGQLRAMAKDGQLTSDVVIAAIESQSDAIEKQSAKMQITAEQGLSQFATGMTLFVGRLDAATGASKGFAEGMDWLGESIGAFGDYSEKGREKANRLTDLLELGGFVALKTAERIEALGNGIGAFAASLSLTWDRMVGNVSEKEHIAAVRALGAAIDEESANREQKYIDKQFRMLGVLDSTNEIELKKTKTHEENKNNVKTEAQKLLEQRKAQIDDEAQAKKDTKQAERDAKDFQREQEKAAAWLERQAIKDEQEAKREYDKRAADFERLEANHNSDLEELDRRKSEELAKIVAWEQQHTDEKQRAEELRAKIDKDYARRKTDLEQAEAVRLGRYDRMNAQNRLQMHERFGQAMIAIGGSFAGKLFKINQAFAFAQAAVALPSAVMQSFENGGGYPWGLIPAGLMLAEGLSQLATIKNQSFDSNGGTGGGVASVGGGAAAGSYGPTPGAPLDNIAQGLEGSTKPPEKLLVSFDITGVNDDAIFTGAQFNRLIDEVNDKMGERNMQWSR